MNVTDRNNRNAGDGDDEFAVFLDALDVAFGSCVDASDHAHAVARVILRRICPEIHSPAPGVRRGDEDEGAHLVVSDGAGLAGLRVGVVHEVLVVVVFEVDQPLLFAADEHQRGDERFFLIGQLPLLVGLDGVDGDVALESRREEGFEVDDPVVEHLEGVPVGAVGGWFDEVGGGGHFFYSPDF